MPRNGRSRERQVVGGRPIGSPARAVIEKTNLAQALEMSAHLAWKRVGRLAVRSRVTREVGMAANTGEDLSPCLKWEHALVGTRHDEAYDRGRGADPEGALLVRDRMFQ